MTTVTSRPDAAPTSTSNPIAYLPGLDGLRAVSVIAVLLYHAELLWIPGGFLGVEVFFVISGYLITMLLMKEHRKTGTIDLKEFWLRRARRLLPALYTLLVTTSIVTVVFFRDELASMRAQVVAAFLYVTNWYLIVTGQSYFDRLGRPPLLRHLWSLAVEEQFYLVWPLLLLALVLIRSPRARLALVGLLAVASAVLMGVLYQPGTDPTRVYYGSDTHSFGLFAGAALALLLRRQSGEPGEFPRARPWLGIAALAGLLAATLWLHADAGVAYRGGLAGVSLLAAVVIWAGVRGGRFGRRLDSAPLRYLGERS